MGSGELTPTPLGDCQVLVWVSLPAGKSAPVGPWAHTAGPAAVPRCSVALAIACLFYWLLLEQGRSKGLD